MPEVLIAARAMNMGVAILKPHLTQEGVEPIGKAVICTVKGDLHDIGKNLVKMMLEGVGIECIDLGTDVSAEQVVNAVKENDAQIVALSSLLTTTMEYHKDVVDALKEMGIPVLRWPGGCFADEYHWKDGIGNKETRKKMINTHWGGVVEDNSFGTHEFFELCEHLISGVCMKCGCYVEFRAAFKRNSCPYVRNRRW